jgi:TBC1 domain family member 5
MRAPDGSYEEGFVVPGTNIAPQKENPTYDLDTNNPLSLHNEVRTIMTEPGMDHSHLTQNPWTEWFASVDLRKTILQDVERT